MLWECVKLHTGAQDTAGKQQGGIGLEHRLVLADTQCSILGSTGKRHSLLFNTLWIPWKILHCFFCKRPWLHTCSLYLNPIIAKPWAFYETCPKIKMCESFYSEQNQEWGFIITFRMSFRFSLSNTEYVCGLSSWGHNYILIHNRLQYLYCAERWVITKNVDCGGLCLYGLRRLKIYIYITFSSNSHTTTVISSTELSHAALSFKKKAEVRRS